jgi:hypothetical protein
VTGAAAYIGRSGVEASHIVNLMIAVAISANVDWFWRGPDAKGALSGKFRASP